MATNEDADSMGSLFEGMVLFNSSQIPDSIDSSTSTSSAPLDENLFSDLTLIAPIDSPAPPPPQSLPSPSPTAAASPPAEIPSGSRLVSRRKKKGGFRVGYGRDGGSSFDEPISSSPPIQSDSSFSVTPRFGQPPVDSSSNGIESEVGEMSRVESVDLERIGEVPMIESEVVERSSEIPSNEIEFEEMGSVEVDERVDEFVVESASEGCEGVSVSSEEELGRIRGGISEKIGRIRGMVSEVSASRKEAARKRRKAAENVNLAVGKYGQLEEELEEACEAEDFERADRVSESLAMVEKEKESFANALRDAEAECDAVDVKMQEVLELLIAAEEEGVLLLEQFAKESADNADLILKNAEERSSKEIDEWSSSMEALEMKKTKLEIESHLINGTRLGLSDSINSAIENDAREKELLCKKKKELTEDLENLLALVREKEAEIAENDSRIAEVENRIADVVSGFNDAQSSINLKYDDMQSVLSMIDLEGESLSTKKKEIDDFVSQEEKKGAMLRELASCSSDEARKCQELVELRKSLALPIFCYREEKMKLAKTEEKIMEEVHTLRQEISSARVSLQELSSSRSRIQEEITSAKQRIFFIDKRSPELEAEKKVAAAARNFKEAARVAAEVKSLGVEKESVKNTMDAAILELEKVEEEINATVERLQKMEELILSKEREAGMAGFERLRLVSAAAMAERSAALDLGDDEEASTLLAEAEAANSEATKLQEAYNLKEEDFGSMAKLLISIELIANLGRKQLAEMAKSVSLSIT